jgi:hypothetical protein
VEPSTAVGVIHEQARGAEPPRVPGINFFKLLHDRRGAKRIEITERAAEKRGKADPKHGTNITVARRTNDAVFEASHGLIQQWEHTAPLNVFYRRGVSRAPIGGHRIHGVIYTEPLPGAIVSIKAGARFPPQSPAVNDAPQ